MISTEYEKWRNLIGDFMLEFAEVESSVLGIFEDFSSDVELEKMKAFKFKPRASNAIELVTRLEADTVIRTPIVHALNELIKLADGVRNLIAHNPLQMSLEGVLVGSNEYEIRSFKDSDKAITFDELLASYRELIHFRDELFHGTYLLRKKHLFLKASIQGV